MVLGCSLYSSQAAGTLRGEMDHALEPAGITQPQFAVLAMLSLYRGASGAELARLTQLTPQTLTVITRNLTAAALIRRVSSADSQWQIPYELTEQGHSVLAHGKQIAAGIEAKITDGYPAEEVAIVKRWLVDVAKRLHTSGSGSIKTGAAFQPGNTETGSG